MENENVRKCTGPPNYMCAPPVRHHRSLDFEWNAENLILCLAAIACTFTAVYILIYLYRLIKSYSRGPITPTPIIPEWLTDLRLLNSNSRVKVYTSTFRSGKEREESYATKKVKKLLTAYKISSKLNLNNFNSNFDLPDNISLIIQVPKKNFKCKEHLDLNSNLNEFEPLSGHLEAKPFHYSYQFFGEQAIQAAYYNIGSASYLAGFTIYIPSPYNWGIRYSKMLLQKLAELPDYYPDAPNKESMSLSWCIIDLQPVIITENCIGEVSRHEMTNEKCFRRLNWCKETYMPNYPISPRITSRKLKVRMCNVLGEPVTIGSHHGEICHVEWRNGKFEVKRCSSCGQFEEEPPKYETVMIF